MSETVEIPKGELDTLRRAYGLLDKLWTDPKQGMAFKKIAKDVDPSLKVPDLDLVQQFGAEHDVKLKAVTDQNEALTARLDKFQSELQERDAEGKLRSNFDKVRKDFSLTDEGLDQVVGLMKDRQIADPEAAAALWARGQPKAPKPISTPTYLPASLDLNSQLGTEEEMKQWLADPFKKFDQVVADELSKTDLAA